MDMNLSLYVNIGGTKIEIVLVNEEGQVLFQEIYLSYAEEGYSLFSVLQMELIK